MSTDLKPIKIKINGKHAGVPAYHIDQGAYPHIRALLTAMGLNYTVDYKVDANGPYVNIITDPSTPAPMPLLGRRIAISAAHGGGRNVSPCHPAYNESDFVLAVALELEEMLIAEGTIVHLPRRSKSEDMSLTERTNRIAAFGADITIDLHTDSIGNGCNAQARGVHAIHQVSRPNDPLAIYLAQEVSRSLGIPVRPRLVWTKEGQPGFDWYHMLRVPHGHNVIVEAGFHSSRDDIAVLMQPGVPRKYAQGVRNGLLKFVDYGGVTNAIENQDIQG